MSSEENEMEAAEESVAAPAKIKRNYPLYLHRESTEEEEAKDGALYKSKIVHSEAEHDLMGEEYFEDLKDIKKVAEIYHRHEPVEAAMIQRPAAIDKTELPESAADMSKEQLIEVLVKHGYKASKLSKKSKAQLLEIFSS